MKRTVYTGPVCYVGHDHEAADGRMLEGGWHYSVVAVPGAPDPGEGASPATMPDRKLVHDPKTGNYHFAAEADESHHTTHHKRLVIAAVDGWIGDPQTDEEHEAVHRHLDDLEQRLDKEGLHAREHGHVLTTPEEIKTMRLWLKRGRP